MAQPVTVYRWDDPGAPQMTTFKPSNLIDILKKCLVEGYGAKPPLGWSISFEDIAATKIVFMNSLEAGGSGGVLRVSAGNAGDTAYANAFFTPAQSALGLNDLFKPGYRHRFYILNSSWSKWAIIGTATGFYLILGTLARVGQHGVVHDSVGFFGDFQSVLPSDAGRFIALVDTTTGGDAALDNVSPNSSNTFSRIWFSSMFWNDWQPLKIYAADGRNTSKRYGCLNVWGNNGSGGSSVIPLSTKQGLYSPLHIAMSTLENAGNTYTNTTDEDGVRMPNSQISPLWRGYLPGAVHEAFGRHSAQLWPVTDEIIGQQHFLLRSTTQVANVWINMESWP